MREQESGGNIINISSVAGTTPDISRLAYGVSKAAINSLTKQTAVEYARDKIRANAVLPWFCRYGWRLAEHVKELLGWLFETRAIK